LKYQPHWNGYSVDDGDEGKTRNRIIYSAQKWIIAAENVYQTEYGVYI